MKEKLNPRIIAATIIAIYMLAVANTIPLTYHKRYIITNATHPAMPVAYCDDSWADIKHTLKYFIILGVSSEFLPLLLIVMANVGMYRILTSQKRMQLTSFSERRIRKFLKAQKIFVAIVAIFFILTMPYAMNLIISTYLAAFENAYVVSHITTLQLVHKFVFTVSIFNSCANPIIYGRVHKKFFFVVKGSWDSLRRTTALTMRRRKLGVTNNDKNSNQNEQI